MSRPSDVFIVKVQAPLWSSGPANGPAPGWLVYNANRSYIAEHNPFLLPIFVRQVLAKHPKAYFRAKLDGQRLRIIQQTKAQPW
jgi:hypothetical protein